MIEDTQQMNGRLNKEQRDVLQRELAVQGFVPIRCSNCGRFLGYERIEKGDVLLRCKCRMFSQVSAPGQEEVE